jgi:hypothetical protein
MSRYVPPAKRWEKPEPKPIEFSSEKEFPALSNVAPRNNFAHMRSFSELASDWKEKAEEERINTEYRISLQKREMEERQHNIVSFNRAQAEDSSDNIEDNHAPFIPKMEDDGWTIVDRQKIMPELSAEDREARARKNAEMSNDQNDSVWVTVQSDADWGFRDRRAAQ